MGKVDILAHRRNKNYSRKTMLVRVLWGFVYPLYRVCPRHIQGWRTFLLKLFGAKIGQEPRIHPSAKIFYPWNLELGDYCTIGPRADIYNMGKIILGDNVMISQGAYLCTGTHDYNQPNLPLVTHPIVIEKDAWICAGAYVGPGVVVGSYSVVGVRSVVLSSIPSDVVVCGNPARIISERQ